MTDHGWEALAAWRDARMGEEGDLWHRTLIDPTLLRVLGSVRGHRVLDVACGNGYLSRRFMRQGARRAVGVDASAGSIRLARARERRQPTGAEFVQGDAVQLAQFGDGTFDRIVANMALMDIRDAEGALREMARLLAPSGRVVFSISHPCFDIDRQSTWLIERAPYATAGRVSRRVEGYRRERTLRLPWPGPGGRVIPVRSYHRTLATYSRYLRAAGLVMVRLEEPAPTPEFVRTSPQGPYIAEIPLHLVVEARPWSEPSAPIRRPGQGRSAGSPRQADRRWGSGGRTRGTGSARRGSTPGS
jgi:SAM-dependent methyltransferase